MKCDQDLFLNLWYDLKKLLLQDELNPRVRCAFGNVWIAFLISFQNMYGYRGLWSLQAEIMVIFEVMTDTQTDTLQIHL